LESPVLETPLLRRVLIVEDEIAIACELEACLQDAGFATVGPAIDRDEAVELIRLGAFDAAIIDVGLMGDCAAQPIEALRERHLPLLFMTGYGETSLPSFVTAGEHFTKPFAIGDLVERLRVHLAPALPV
jgi:DNA-binding response OmpR family regulator